MPSFYVKLDAERFRDKVERDLYEGNSTEPLSARSKTFRQVAELAMDSERIHLKQDPRRLRGCLPCARVPDSETAPHLTVSAADVQAWLADPRAKPKANGQPRSETSVLGTYKAVAKAFSYAYKHRLIPFNPCIAVVKPEGRHLRGSIFPSRKSTRSRPSSRRRLPTISWCASQP